MLFQNPDDFPVDLKDYEEELFEGLVKSLRFKPRTKNFYVNICQVCSRIIVEMVGRIIAQMFYGKDEWLEFDYGTGYVGLEVFFQDLREEMEEK